MIEHMCEICDGRTPDSVRIGLAEKIDDWGWAIVAVSGDPAWCYTVGLLERFGHPELVMAGVDRHEAARLLNGLGASIREGHRYAPGGAAPVDSRAVGFGAVHPVQADHGVFAAWFDHYRFWPGERPDFSAVQVIGPESKAPRLDGPDDVLGAGRASRPNRAERRSAGLRAGRRRPPHARPAGRW